MQMEDMRDRSGEATVCISVLGRQQRVEEWKEKTNRIKMPTLKGWGEGKER